MCLCCVILADQGAIQYSQKFRADTNLADFAPVSRNIKGFEVEFEGIEGFQNVVKDHPRFEFLVNWPRLPGKDILASVQV